MRPYKPPEWEASPQTSLYSSLANESSSFVPRLHIPELAEASGWFQRGWKLVFDSPPMRTVESPPYLSTRESSDAELQKEAYSRLPSYSASPSLRLPPPTPSSAIFRCPKFRATVTLTSLRATGITRASRYRTATMRCRRMNHCRRTLRCRWPRL
ncbi:hypothetical protein BC629DRAFT_253431 [Irpex lacteus]|nr:hypothetical protein BC629DRAFT_253431 [Irpex lacteus]